MITLRKSLFLIYIISFSNLIFGKELIYLGRSPKALIMGDAFTSLADDSFTLFYNPAALASNNGVSISPINPLFGITNIISDLDKVTNLPSDSVEMANQLMNFPIYLDAGIYPTIKVTSFGFTFFSRSQNSFSIRNVVHPFLEIDYRNDTGFIIGQAFTFGTSARKKSNLSKIMLPGNRISFGLALKYLRRESISNRFDLLGPKLLNTLSSGIGSSPSALKNALGFSSGTGIGFDMGAIYSFSMENSQFSMGLSFLDVMNTKFTKEQGEEEMPVQKMYINSGINWRQDFMLFNYALSLDFAPLNQSLDFERTIHLGLEVGVPFVTAYGGYNEGYLCYGLETRLWPFKIMLGVNGVELGRDYRQAQGKRAFIYLSLFDVSLEAF